MNVCCASDAKPSRRRGVKQGQHVCESKCVGAVIDLAEDLTIQMRTHLRGQDALQLSVSNQLLLLVCISVQCLNVCARSVSVYDECDHTCAS